MPRQSFINENPKAEVKLRLPMSDYKMIKKILSQKKFKSKWITSFIISAVQEKLQQYYKPKVANNGHDKGSY